MHIYQNHRVGIFIDVQNIYHSAKNLYHSRVNFQELVKHLLSRRELIKAYAYVVKSETALGEESFFEALEKSGIDLRIKDLQVYAGGAKKGDWDVGLAIDTVRSAEGLDVIILVTGDGDFVPLIEYLRLGKGKQVEVAAFSRTASARIKEAADTFVEIENVPKVLLKINKRRTKNRASTKN